MSPEEEKRPGRSIGAKQARALCTEFAGVRVESLERAHSAGSRHQVFRLSDARIVDLFLKSARLYGSQEEFLQDVTRGGKAT